MGGPQSGVEGFCKQKYQVKSQEVSFSLLRLGLGAGVEITNCISHYQWMVSKIVKETCVCL